jgi:hypothetical protein
MIKDVIIHDGGRNGSELHEKAASATTCRQITTLTNIGSIHQGNGTRNGSKGTFVPHGGREIRCTYMTTAEPGR